MGNYEASTSNSSKYVIFINFVLISHQFISWVFLYNEVYIQLTELYMLHI